MIMPGPREEPADRRRHGNRPARECVRRRLARSVGDSPTQATVRGLVAWIAGRREIEFLKPIDKAIQGMVSESSGRNNRERKVTSKCAKPQGPSLYALGEGGMNRRNLTEAAESPWRGNSDGTMARTREATGETRLAPSRKRWSRKPYNRNQPGNRRTASGRRLGE
jgi:hypothetical protein